MSTLKDIWLTRRGHRAMAVMGWPAGIPLFDPYACNGAAIDWLTAAADRMAQPNQWFPSLHWNYGECGGWTMQWYVPGCGCLSLGADRWQANQACASYRSMSRMLIAAVLATARLLKETK